MAYYSFFFKSDIAHSRRRQHISVIFKNIFDSSDYRFPLICCNTLKNMLLHTLINKISRNIERDDEINKKLLFMGWTVIRFWGNEIKKNVNECIQVIEETIFDIKIGENEADD